MENWRLIDNYKYIYYVSDQGNVINNKGKEMKQHADKDGYLRVRFINKKDNRIPQMVHRLVAIAFIFGNINLTINHIDGDKTNNIVDNLEWLSRADNNKHAYETGLKNNKGVNHGKARFTNEEILLIRKLYQEGNYTQSKLAEQFKTKQSRISEIIKKKSWKHI